MNYYVFTATIEQNDIPSALAYCCLMPASASSGWNKDEPPVVLEGGSILRMKQQLLPETLVQPFLSDLEQGQVCLSYLGLSLPSIPIKARRQTLRSGFGGPVRECRSFCTLPDIKVSFPSAVPGRALQVVLKAIDGIINLELFKASGRFFGQVDVFGAGEWDDTPKPFILEATAPDKSKGNAGIRWLEISRSPEFARYRHMAHLVCRAGKDIVLDRLIFLESGQLRSEPIRPSESISSYEFWLFDEQGKTLHYEENSFLRTMVFNMNMFTGSTTVEDNLAHRAKSQGKKVNAINNYLSDVSQVGATPDVENFAYNLRDLLSEAKPSQDKWFPRGLDGELGVIQHLQRLLDGNITQAILVDPFFDVEALFRFVLRLESGGLNLTIITCLDDNFLKPLRMRLDKIQSALHLRLRIISLRTGGKQAFHDRYLLLYPREGLPKVFMLSNSINAMAENWPFCLSLLSPDAAVEAKLYIEGLCRGEDITGSVNPTITFQWPAP